MINTFYDIVIMTQEKNERIKKWTDWISKYKLTITNNERKNLLDNHPNDYIDIYQYIHKANKNALGIWWDVEIFVDGIYRL